MFHVTARLADGTIKAVWQGAPLLARDGNYVIAARWERRPVAAGPLQFQPGDVIVEFFSDSLWYNVFAVWDTKNRRQRGWYVNLARPMTVEHEGTAYRGEYVDLALDFIVTPHQVLELDTEVWLQVREQLPGPDRQQADAVVDLLRQRLLSAGVPPAWKFLEEMMGRVASTEHERRLPQLAGSYGRPLTVSIELDWHGHDLRRWDQLNRAGERDGEAIYVMRLPRGETLLHTKADYPPGVFRLPGGGLARGESPVAGAIREALEETGIATQPVALLAYANMRLRHASGILVMPNYVFLLEPIDFPGEPMPSAEEGITQWLRVPWRDLELTAKTLSSLEGTWRPWGVYRAIPHILAYRAISAYYAW